MMVMTIAGWLVSKETDGHSCCQNGLLTGINVGDNSGWFVSLQAMKVVDLYS